MNEVLVRNWNSRIKEHDIVIFLGDFAFRQAGEDNIRKWLSLLHGHITFVKGNHDGNNSLNTRIQNLVMTIAGKQIYCVHSPQNYNRKFHINLVGHVHEKWKIQQRGFSYLVNVGVDVWSYSPITIDEILKAISKYKNHPDKLK